MDKNLFIFSGVAHHFILHGFGVSEKSQKTSVPGTLQYHSPPSRMEGDSSSVGTGWPTKGVLTTLLLEF